MGKDSKIEWTDSTWNPAMGCTPVSQGCTNCFARAMIKRFAGLKGWPGVPEKVTLFPERLEQPLHWDGHKQIFVCSMSDLFHEDVPDDFIWDVLDVMVLAKRHIFQVLTKRPERMRKILAYYKLPPPDGEWGESAAAWILHRPENIWLGVSVENQAAADERREYLRQTSAAVKFVSYEPALAPVDWTGWEFVDQIISGGESGPKARPSHPDWYRATRDFCQRNGIAYFHKQNGEYVECDGWNQWGTSLDGAFVDPAKVRAVRVVPGGDIYDVVHMVRVGRKRAGHLLDGEEWREFPQGERE